MNLQLYISDHCIACEEVLAFFDQKNIEYELINVTHDQVKFDEMLRLGGIATPLIVWDGEVIYTFDPNKFETILEGKNG
ncbi:glutaredoxin family protein [Chengkuizengella axinellae]|uniref:Glutaredoxin family protein n=1 Tax=Chengkuizengella axinellae TaxID=3064388 RepID=A0ABT9J2A8_9BACL|nr:glutaredoxin family protein [Chengkuizengella sp. 2205SS18-9]MDP5275751.1 glutaredoxin family protein [Chengkuizengella sp. 2205SS18-9]